MSAFFTTGSGTFVTACDRFVVCDSSGPRICCPCAGDISIQYKYFVSLPCGDVEFVVPDDPFTDNGCDLCDDATNGLDNNWPVAYVSDCEWFEQDDDVLQCTAGDLDVRRDFMVRCCDDGGTIRVILEAQIWLINGSQDRHVFVKELASITDQAGCEFIDLSDLDETLDYVSPSGGHPCQREASLTPIHCDPPATLRVRAA